MRARTVKVIEQKVEGQEITAEPAEEPKAQVIDLMDALKASLAKKRKPARKSTTARASAKKAAKKRAKS